MPLNPLNDIAGMVAARVASHTTNIQAAVDAALHPDRLRSMVESSFKNLSQQVDAVIAAKVAKCITEKLGLASIDAQIGSLISAQVDLHVLDKYGC